MNVANLMAFGKHWLALLQNCDGSEAGFRSGLTTGRATQNMAVGKGTALLVLSIPES